MAIRNPVLFGLKVSFSLTDVESKNTALNSLGLDIRDLAVIEGISSNLRTEELQNVSGLDVNLTRYLDRLKSDSSRYVGLINLISGYLVPTRGNLEAYGAVSGGAMRFQYVPNDKGDNVTKNDVKYGDISTSRVSAWSGGSEGDPTSAISYGASVQVRGTLKLGNSDSYTVPTNQSILNVLDTPEPVRFDTEVPTDIIKFQLNSDGGSSPTYGYLYAMRGIPQIFTVAFKNIAMDFDFTPYPVNGVNKTPIYTLTDTDTGYEIVSRPSATTRSRLRYNTTSFKERQLRIYFPPAYIKTITGNNLNLTQFPVVKYPNATSLTFANNLLTEMPDWTTINYVQTYNTNNPPQITSESATLRTVNLQNNLLYQSGIEEERQFGSKLMKKLPKTLRVLNLRGCYNGNTEFLNQEEMMVLKVTQSEYNNVLIDRDNKQEFTFAIGNPSQSVTIKGKYFDKHRFDDVYYVYIDEPSSTTVITGISNYWETVDVLDLATRCPELQDFNIQDLGARRIFRTSASRIVDKTSTTAGVRNIAYTTNQEETPRVNIKEIRTYNIYNCYFTRISPVFEDPENIGGLGSGEVSQLRTFQVGENEALTSTVGLNFSRMTSISSISLYDTALPIPSGLENKTTLSSLNCNYTRFPTRSPAPTANHLAPGGTPIAQNNYLWSNSSPTALGNYALNGCSNLRSLNFYASRLDGMIPKFLGNGQLRTVDFRYSRIEGGRPGGAGASFNGGEHGRRYIMWDDTFEEAQRVSTIRIISSYLGRNIGTWNGSTYTGAEFQAATFNLPSLSYLQIQSTGGYLTGDFFSTSGAPNLRYIISENNGWGSGTATGNTPLPTFSANSRIYYIALRNNKFNGTIELVNLTNLRYFYVSSNEIESVGTLQNLSRLNYFIAGNNSISSAFPDFSNGAPNIQYISLNNNNMTVFGQGALAGATRLRSLDISNNSFNTANIDLILEDLLANYNAARRSGVIVNLSGNTGQPSSNPVTTPTSSTTKEGEETITVSQTDPANPTATFAAATLDLRNDTPNSTTTYFTKLFIDGSEVSLPNSSVSINYSNDTVTFTSGSEPTDGTVIKLEVWKTVTGSVTTLTGGIVIVNELRAKGWTINF